MELILISDTKLKIMLDEEDMKKYRISGDSDCPEATTGQAIRSLLEFAGQRVGFKTEGEELFVQLYASKHGGCELFVTKSPSILPRNRTGERKKRDSSQEISEDKTEKGHSPAPQVKTKLSAPLENRPALREYKHSPMAFSFLKLCDLISVCRILATSKPWQSSHAFSDGDGYYLYLPDTGASAYSRLDRLTFILEYGKRENPEALLSYISEHGRILCRENAIEILSRL